MTTTRDKLVRVKTVYQTCDWCPAQWEGRTDDGRPVYARFRHGWLSVRVGKIGGTIAQAVRSDRLVVDRRGIGHPYDGFMTYSELKRHTKGVIEWPKRQKRKSLV